MLENGKIIDFRGTFAEYRAWKERKRQAAAPEKGGTEGEEGKARRRRHQDAGKAGGAAEREVTKAEERQYDLTLEAAGGGLNCPEQREAEEKGL